MRKSENSTFIVLLISLALGSYTGLCQRVGVNTDEIESLIDEWNFANNTRNIHSFEKVYDSRLVFYTQDLTRDQAISLKQQLFRKKPYFRQRITTEITFTPYSGGVVKCDFTKEVFEKTNWKKYPSYLLVSYENNRYSIVGESDYQTDRVLKYKQKIGDPISFDKRERVNAKSSPDTSAPDLSTSDTSLVFTPPVSPPFSHIDSITTREAIGALEPDLTIEEPDAVFSDLSSMGMITIPRGYVFLLIAMLGLGGLMIFVADSVHTRKKRRIKFSHEHAEAEQVVHNFKMQSAFEAFVVTLFDPLFFRHRRPKTEHVYAGKDVRAEAGPDLVFDFHQKDTHARFAIKCQYYKNAAKNEVQLFTTKRQQLFRQFEAERDMSMYYVLGFGGQPDDPRELFFVPAKDVTGEYMTRGALMKYSKSGMFYYNRKTGRIQ